MIPQIRSHKNPEPEDGRPNALTRLRAAMLRATLKLGRKSAEKLPPEA